MVHILNMWEYHHPLFVEMCICTFITKLRISIINIFLMVILFWSNHVCCKHEIPQRCFLTMNLQAYLWHPKHIFLQTHMGNIWYSHHCDPKLWTFIPHPQQVHWWRRRLWRCLCTTSPLIIEQYPHDIFLLPHLKKYDICPFTVPCHNCIVVPNIIVIKNHVWIGLLTFFAFILTTWHGCLCIKKNDKCNCKKNWNHKESPNFLREWKFSSRCITLIATHNLNHTCQRESYQIPSSNLIYQHNGNRNWIQSPRRG
jgi:hypothetical protein